MPLPASYTSTTLVSFMEDALGPVGEDLAIGDTELLSSAADDVAGLFGVSDVTSITYGSVANVMKVRALARWQAWLAARRAAARQFDTKPSSGREFKLRQVWEQINYELREAAIAAAAYPEGAGALGGGSVVITSIADSGPYATPALAASEFG